MILLAKFQNVKNNGTIASVPKNAQTFFYSFVERPQSWLAQSRRLSWMDSS